MCKQFALGVLSLAFFILAGCSDSGGGSGTGPGSVKPYPLKVCLVTDNDLGSMGDPVSIVHEGQEVKFCCHPCIKKFRAEPEKFLKKLGQKK